MERAEEGSSPADVRINVKLWDAEKRLKSAEKALAHEDEREEQAKRVRLQEREDKAARRAGGRVKYGADADKQYGE